MPVQSKGTISVPIKKGPKMYENTFYVLIEAASDCPLGLDFLESNNRDALFSERKLKIDRNASVLSAENNFHSTKNKFIE